MDDAATGSVRRAVLKDGRLEQALFLTVSGRLPPRDWLAGLMAHETLPPDDRMMLLAGRPAILRADVGTQVCACLKVGAKTIVRAIGEGALDIDAVGAATGAGTSCGSCRPEIARLIAGHAKPKVRDAA